jgi:hypothetical protein
MSPHYPAPLGSIEPHAPLLQQPDDDQRLFKVMTVENLVQSIERRYLHFNRVDSYTDFPKADAHDGEQLPLDRTGNAKATFQMAPDFTAADYYDQSRRRTYACCFSTTNSDRLWQSYGNGGSRGKVCLVTRFARLRARISQSMPVEGSKLLVGDTLCDQIFSVNYGMIQYVDRINHRTGDDHLPNPIIYTYLKDKEFEHDSEVRISLSAFGVGRYVTMPGRVLEFPPSLQLTFDVRAAMADGTIECCTFARGSDVGFLRAEFQRLNIEPVEQR